MAHGQRAIDDALLHRARQFEQPQQIGDMAARFVDELAQSLLGMPEILDQAMIRLGLFDRIEILPLNILDQRDFERFGIVERADDHRHLVQPRTLRRTPAPLARDDLIAGAVWAHDDRLQYAAQRDRLREFLERRFVEMPPRLSRMRGQRADRERSDTRRGVFLALADRLFARQIAHQGVEAASQPRAGLGARHGGRRVGHAALAGCGVSIAGSRAISSRASAI